VDYEKLKEFVHERRGALTVRISGKDFALPSGEIDLVAAWERADTFVYKGRTQKRNQLERMIELEKISRLKLSSITNRSSERNVKSGPGSGWVTPDKRGHRRP